VEHTAVSVVVLWQEMLGTIGIFNLCVWVLVAAAVFSRRRNAARPGAGPAVAAGWQLVLSAIFVSGCAFRSVLPRADVQRIVLYDGWISSVFVGRSVATVAELAFVAQCALLIHAMGREQGVRPPIVIAQLLLPLIVVAEVCSWYAVLTTNYLGNVFEDSIWALTAGLAAAAFLLLGSRSADRKRRTFFFVAAVASLVYASFNCTVDVPNYVHRWLHDERDGRAYLSLGAGLHDCARRWVVTREWKAWRAEIPWMTLYFSVGVWISMGMARFSAAAPRRVVSMRG
jgi:hypothetical protein